MSDPSAVPPSRQRRLRALLAVASLAPAVGAAAALGPVSSSAGASTARLASALVEVGHAATPPAGARDLGAVPARQRVSFGIGLQGRDPAGLAAYAAAVSTPGSYLYHRFLTPASFAARFGASAATARALAHQLRASGLSVGHASANGLLLPVSGTAGRVESALHTALRRYRLSDGTVGFAESRPAYLARSAASGVAAVVGLDSLETPRSMLERAPRLAARPSSAPVVTSTPAPAGSPRACTAATLAAQQGSGWTDQQLAAAYGLEGLYRRGDLGRGQTIAVFELEPYAPSDLASFDRCYFGASHTNQVSLVRVDGFNLTGSGSGEALLDLEDIQALAPAAKVLVYAAPNTTFGAVDTYNAIVSQDRANLVSTSWGECETALQQSSPQVQQLENTLFEEAAAQGQTVFAAAGDTGSDDCASTPWGSTSPAAPYLSVDDPASQPYVVGVGGTSMLNDVNPPTQTVWNDGAKWGGAGGGISNTWTSPAWQSASGVPGVSRTLRRQVPDVSATADEWRGITVFSALFGNPSSGAVRARPRVSAPTPPAGWATLGGTSSAAPIWAAVAAEIAASPACASVPTAAGQRSLGFVAPLLYEVAARAATYRSSFDNVTRGSNDVFGIGLGYRAHAGYSLAAGLGTPIVTNAQGAGGLDASLCALASAPLSAPTVTGLAPAAGPTTGGGTVTISGSGFPVGDPGALKVNFGSAAATVTAVPSATTAQVTVPAAALAAATVSPGGATLGGAGPVQVSVTVVAPTGRATSRPSAVATYNYVAVTNGVTVPTVSGVGPVGGNVAGGNRVVIYGSGFDAGSTPSVTFGGVPATGVRVLSGSQLAAVVPAETGTTTCATGTGFAPATNCQVQVVVTDSRGSSATAPILPPISGPLVYRGDGVVVATPEIEISTAATEYDYSPTPHITSIAPNPGDATGQTPVAIIGSGFSYNTLAWINFGPPGDVLSEQTQVLSVTPTEIVIAPPAASAAGPTPQRLRGGVSVQTLAGRSNTVSFSYGGTPTVTSLSTLGGPSTGGTLLRVTGAGMSAVDVVEFLSQTNPNGFGGSASVAISKKSATGFSVHTPAFLPGPVDVLACTASACSRPDPGSDTFVYFSPGRPIVQHANRTSGPASGGTVVTLVGEGLNGATGVRFGAAVSKRLQRAPGFPDGDPYVLGVVAPPGTAGATVPMVVVNHSGASTPVPGASFHYLPSAPSAPQGVALAVHGSSARVSWHAPSSTGGSPVTAYTVLLLASGMAPRGGTVGRGARSVVVHGLAAGGKYTARVAASNAARGRGLWAAAGPKGVAYHADGYRVVRRDGVVEGFGSLPALGGIGGVPLASPVVAIADTPDDLGYWLLQADGTVTAFGDATRLGFVHPASPLVGLTPTASGNGYWLVDRSGQVYDFGDAASHGSLAPGKLHPGAHVVALVPSPGDKGYWLVASDGAVYSFGAVPKKKLSGPPAPGTVVAAAAAGTDGLLLATSEGRVLALGTAHAAAPAPSSASPVVAMTATAGGKGYWLLRADGSVLAFGAAQGEGHASLPASAPAAAIAAG